jgi:hypothetical protein
VQRPRGRSAQCGRQSACWRSVGPHAHLRGQAHRAQARHDASSATLRARAAYT